MPLASASLPAISAPALRVTRTGEQMTQFVRGDLEEIRKQAPAWVRATAAEQIAKQIQLGNSRQYTAVVDGAGKEVAGKGVYAKVGGKDIIYLLSLEVLNHLKKEVRDTAVFNFAVGDVVAVKFTGWYPRASKGKRSQ